MKRDPWKLVTDAGELRPGMTVEFRPNRRTGSNARRILIKRKAAPGYGCATCLEELPNDYDWDTGYERHSCFSVAIPERRLYALVDDDTAADETTVTRRRELADR